MTPRRADGIRTYRNPRAAASTEPYPSAHAAILDGAGFSAAFDEIRGWPGYAVTPLQRLRGLAARLGIAELHFKDEGGRFGLKSFKALGGAYAVFRALAEAIRSVNGGRAVAARELVAGTYKDITGDITMTCATDGNHGRSVAWGAQLFGCRCVIFVHEQVSAARRAAIVHYGAEVIEVSGNYDDSVRHAATEASMHGWTVVSDTTYEGYREIPVDVMHGYGVMAREVIGQMAGRPPTHVFVQAGVGGLAAAICAAFWIEWGEARPQLVVVEPDAADCYFRSAQAGVPVAVTGNLDTVMAGLACGEVSPLAWEILRDGANAFAAIDDRYALDAMRVLARPAAGDSAIVAGETGGCGLALLLALQAHPEHRVALALTTDSRVLLIGSEGDTDPALYRQIVGSAASSSTS